MALKPVWVILSGLLSYGLTHSVFASVVICIIHVSTIIAIYMFCNNWAIAKPAHMLVSKSKYYIFLSLVFIFEKSRHRVYNLDIKLYDTYFVLKSY